MKERDEAVALTERLEGDLEDHGNKRMLLEKELNDVHRLHQHEIAAKQAAYDQLRTDFEKLQHYNLKLREELNRCNRELMGVLSRKHEMKKEAEREARRAIQIQQQQRQTQGMDTSRRPIAPYPLCTSLHLSPSSSYASNETRFSGDSGASA